MGSDEAAARSTATAEENSPFKSVYRFFAYFGLFSIFGSVLYGFQYDPAAPAGNFGYNLLLYGVFIAPHLIMTRSWFKQALWGNPAGSPAERRIYITITVVMWLAIFILHEPVPGAALEPAGWIRFAGVILFLWTFFKFFEGATTEILDGLLGVPGAVGAYSHGPETPLFTEGGYAQVRHPQYRAFISAAAASLLIHPNMGQFFWALLLSATFVAFIPVEEKQLLRARGDDYRKYAERTPWRLFRGIW
jgi:protein-S-isoprenylcysteine O-methyltransferase Ste14